MENLIENNILIARFMGVEMSDELYKGHPTFVGEHLVKAGLPFHCGIMGNCTDNPPFDSDWNWLMPVLHKCFAYDNLRMKQEINLAMFGYNNIEAVWLAVVKFIKWFNSQNK